MVKQILFSLLALLFWLNLFAILYTYFGYPLLIWLLPNRKIEEHRNNLYLPTLTLLIAAYNERDFIEEKIKNSLAIKYPKEKLQILIVSDGSDDGTNRIAETYAKYGVVVQHQDERHGKIAAINRGMPLVTGEIVVFSDANNTYLPDTLEKLVQPFADPSVGAVSGSKTIQTGDGELGNSEGLYWKYESFIKKQESRVSSCTSVAGEILAIRKSLYIPPPAEIITDDFFIAMQVLRQNYRLVYVEDAKSVERASATAQDELIRRRRINAGRYQSISMFMNLLPKQPILIWQIISHKYLRPLVPFFMILVFVLNGLAVLFPYPFDFHLFYLSHPINIIFFILQLLFYGLAIAGIFIGKQNGNSRLRLLFYLPTFLVNSNYAALQGFFQFMRGTPGHLWQKAKRR